MYNEDEDIYEKYGHQYEDLRINPDEDKSVVLPVAAGFFGALIGVLPGCLVWIFLGNLGVIAAISGAVMALGAVLGYKFTSNIAGADDELLPAGIAVIGLIILVAVYLSARYVYVGKLSDALDVLIVNTRNAAIEEYVAEGGDRSAAEKLITNEYVVKFVCDDCGIPDTSRKSCSTFFTQLLKNFDLKSKYTMHIFECYICAASGVLWMCSKAFPNNGAFTSYMSK